VKFNSPTHHTVRQGNRGLAVLGFAVFLTLVITLPFPTLAQQVSQDRETVGVPWSGENGSRETMADITARQQREDQLARGKPKKFRLKTEKEAPDRDELPQDPASPAVARWVPSRNIADNISTRAAPLAPQSLGVNFTGATLADTGAFPPDSMGTVGPSQFVVFVNGRIRSFNKATGVADGVLNVDPDVFFSSVVTPVPPAGLNFTSDPQIRHDRLSGRWLLSIIDVPSSTTNTIGDTANRWLLAVSDAASSNALSGGTVWTFFFVQQNTVGGGDSGEFLDYPSLGVDANALYVGGNMFGASSGAFNGCSAFVIRKTSVLSGGPLVVTAFRGIVPNSTSDGPFAPRGVDNYDPAANEGYIIGPSATTLGRLIFRRVSTPGGTPTISANILLTVNSTSTPIPVQHLGNTGGNNGRLDSLEDRIFAAHIRNGRLWTAHNIAVSATGVAATSGAQRRDAVRWYELNGIRSTDNGGTPVVVQSGTIFDNTASLSNTRQYWMPSVMVSGQGHAALGFSTAGTPFHINAATAGRLVGDPLGTLQAFTNYTASATAYNPSSDPGSSTGRRWGDYSFTSLDPNDDMTMWTIQEFCDSANSYGVRVVKLFAPPPATPVSCSPASITQGVANVSVIVSGTLTNGSGFFDPGAGFPNHISATVNGGSATVNSVAYSNPTNITLNITVASNAVAGVFAVTVTNPDGQSVASASGILTIVSPLVSFNLSVLTIGAGTGTVTSAPAGISCGATCSASFASNSVVTLTATADTNSAFQGWSGGCVGTGACVVTPISNTTSTANFDALPVIAAASIAPGSPTTTNDLVVSVTSSNDADGDPIIVAYQWQQSTDSSNFSNIAFTTNPLPASATIAGDYYRVLLTPNDGVGNGPTFTTASVLVPVDADGNGINDDWEMKYFGHIGIDPNADPDGDGFSNLQEFLAGTDPTNGASALHITSVTATGDDILINWITGIGVTNALQAVTGTGDGSYNSNSFTEIFIITNTLSPFTNFLDIGAATNFPSRFYRVRLVP
jgi:Divergent InlB B-repeat domain